LLPVVQDASLKGSFRCTCDVLQTCVTRSRQVYIELVVEALLILYLTQMYEQLKCTMPFQAVLGSSRQ
jgi:hypothetical protein